MTKRLGILIGVLLAVGLGLLVWLGSGPREPVYEGKPLSLWLENHTASSSANPPYGSRGWLKVNDVLRQIGTNGIPTLLRMIAAKDPPKPVLKLIEFARTRQRLIPIRYHYATQRNEEARYAFELLRTNAAGAVPGLIRIYQAGVSASSRSCAAQALGYIGHPAQAALPVLLKDFTNSDWRVRFDAVTAVSRIRGDPDVLIPAFTRALKDPRWEVRANAASGLYLFYGRARSAVPDLLTALNDPAMAGNDNYKTMVEDALWMIGPEKAGHPQVVEDATPLVVDGITTESVDIVYNAERRTLIEPGRKEPCLTQFWNSGPRGVLTLYRSQGKTAGPDHELGQFEVLGIAPPPSNVNVSVLCIIADQQILLNARDNNTHEFLQIRRVE